MADLNATDVTGGQRIFSVEEASDLLRIGRSTLYDLMRDRKVPYRRIGARGRGFTQADIDSIINDSLVPAVTR